MRRLTLLAAAALIILSMAVLSGCGTPATPYYLQMINPVVTNDLSYEDQELNYQIIFSDISAGINFKLTNLSADETIKIIWDNCVFTDFDGKSSRVLHEGIKFTDIEKPMAPTIIAPGGYIEDIMLPALNVVWTGSKWQFYYLVSPSYVSELAGKTISFMICFERGGVTKNVNFKFKVMLGEPTAAPADAPAAAPASTEGKGMSKAPAHTRELLATLTTAQLQKVIEALR